DVDVQGGARMQMADAAVMMGAGWTGGPEPRREIDGASAKADEHDRDAELEEIRDADGQLGAKHQHEGTDGHERERMSQAPAGAEERRLVAAALAADQRRHGREMIRFERVAHAEQRAETGAGHEFEYWHNAGASTFYV